MCRSCNVQPYNKIESIIVLVPFFSLSIGIVLCLGVIIYSFINLFLHLSSVRLVQGTVTSLVEKNGTIKGVQYKNKSGQETTAYAPLTIVCDGCFSNLRRTLCNPKVRTLFNS